MKNLNLVALSNIVKMGLFASVISLPLCASADDNAPIDNTQEENTSQNQNFENEWTEEYFYGEDIELTPQEKKALKLTQDWNDATASTAPVRGPAGQIQFVYGGQSIDIVCAVLQVCDIQLQQGEEVTSIHIGDGARWKIEPAITGFGASEIQHLVIKPLDCNLKTNLLVTTNRRSYHINLKSHKTELMPEVSFIYPEDAIQKFKLKNQRRQNFLNNNTIASTNEYLGDLDFNYKIDGDKDIEWTPVRVYNNGVKTIIQLDEKTTYSEIPTLLVMDKASNKEKIVNYRFINNRFVVDSIFQEAILIMGVGSAQEKVTISKISK